MDKKDLENNNPQMSAVEAFRKTQKQMDEMNSAIGFPQGVLEAIDSLNIFKQSNAFESVQKIAEQFPHISTLDQLSTKPEIKSAIDNFNKSMAFHPSLFESLASNREIMNSFTDSFRTFKSDQKFPSLSDLYGKNEIRDLSSILSSNTQLFKEYDQFKNLSSLKILESLNRESLRRILGTIPTKDDIEEFSEKSIAEIDDELSQEVKFGNNFQLYSEKNKKLLSYFFHTYLLQFLFLITGILIAPYIQQVKSELNTLTTQQEVKSFVRSPPPLINRQALKGYRFTTVNNLNFRDNFGMNSTIIDTLPIGTIVRVVDKSNKSWLLVEVEIDGTLEQGWILRRYTTYFK